MMGGPVEIAMAALTAFFGVWLISAALAGYFVDRLSLPMRIVFAAAGLAALIPAGAFEGAVYTDIGGAIVGVAAIAWCWITGRTKPSSQAAQ